MKLIPLLVLAISIVVNAYSQEADSTEGAWALTIKADYGFIIIHHQAMQALENEHSRGFEMSFSKISAGREEWERSFLNPAKGLTLAVIQTGSPHLGIGIAFYPWIDFPLGTSAENRLDFRYGLGLGWVENIFSPDDNYKNAAIGSHINGVIHFDLHFEKKLGKRSKFEIGAGITHFSNASIKLPNLGINIAAANLAYTHIFGRNKVFVKVPVIKKIAFTEWSVSVTGGSKEIYPPEGNSYGAGVVSVMRLHRYSQRNSWGIGHDLFFDKSLQIRELRMNWKSDGFSDNLRLGLYGTYVLNAGKLELFFGMGAYYFSRWKEDGFIYHRLGLRYSLNKFFLCMNLKTHFARADFLELGIGYRFITHLEK